MNAAKEMDPRTIQKYAMRVSQLRLVGLTHGGGNVWHANFIEPPSKKTIDAAGVDPRVFADMWNLFQKDRTAS